MPFDPTSPNSWNSVDIFNGARPVGEKPKALPFTFDFTVSTSYKLNLLQANQQGILRSIQGVYIDNSANSVPLTVSFPLTGQTIVCAPNKQGTFPAISSNPPIVQVSCAGTRGIVIFLNVPVPAAVWSATQDNGTYNGGALEVSDTALEALISGGALNVNSYLTGDSASQYPEFSGSVRYTGTLTAAGASAAIITGNPGWFMTDIDVSLSGDAALAAAGEFTVLVQDNAATIMQAIAVLPAAATAGALAPIKLIDKQRFQYVGKTATKSLTLSLSAALTAGKLVYNIGGGITQIVG